MTDHAALAAEVQAWVDATWDESMTVRQWWRCLADAGYTYPEWPVGVGGSGVGRDDARTIMEALAKHRVVASPVGHVAATLAAPTLFEHGTRDQVGQHVRAIALGEAAWCQLFSEPGSGSDLASIGARAIRDGDEWVVTGQKVWNSGADSADFGMLLARTERDLPKHQGISYFVIDMHQPGVEVRPLRQMNGMSSFCEVFLTEARVGVDGVLGAVNDGWAVAQTTLRHERRSVAGAGAHGLVPAASGAAGDLDMTVGQVVERARRGEEARRRVIRGGAVPARMMIELAEDYGTASLPDVRQELARYLSRVRVNGWTARRIAAAGGRLTEAGGSMAKLATARICQQSRELSYRIVGAAGMLSGAQAPLGGELQVVALRSPGTRIGGGTDEIQLNVLGERALGLPREPTHDRDVPYRDLKVGTQH